MDENKSYESDKNDQDEDTSNFVMGYQESTQRARAGAGLMGSQIEGTGILARAQQRIERRQLGSQIEGQLLAYYTEVSQLYRGFAADDEVIMMQKFKGLKHYKFKNPQVFLLAYIAYTISKNGKDLDSQTVKLCMNLATDTDQLSITEESIIRYWRLISGEIRGAQ